MNVKKELKKRHLTLREFAPLCGMSFQQLGLYTSGKYKPSFKSKEKIRIALEIYDETH